MPFFHTALKQLSAPVNLSLKASLAFLEALAGGPTREAPLRESRSGYEVGDSDAEKYLIRVQYTWYAFFRRFEFSL